MWNDAVPLDPVSVNDIAEVSSDLFHVLSMIAFYHSAWYVIHRWCQVWYPATIVPVLQKMHLTLQIGMSEPSYKEEYTV